MEWYGNITNDLVIEVRMRDAPQCIVSGSTDPLFLVRCLGGCNQTFCCGRYNDWRNHGCNEETYQSVANQWADRLTIEQLNGFVAIYENPNNFPASRILELLARYCPNGILPREGLYNYLMNTDIGIELTAPTLGNLYLNSLGELENVVSMKFSRRIFDICFISPVWEGRGSTFSTSYSCSIVSAKSNLCITNNGVTIMALQITGVNSNHGNFIECNLGITTNNSIPNGYGTNIHNYTWPVWYKNQTDPRLCVRNSDVVILIVDSDMSEVHLFLNGCLWRQSILTVEDLVVHCGLWSQGGITFLDKETALRYYDEYII